MVKTELLEELGNKQTNNLVNHEKTIHIEKEVEAKSKFSFSEEKISQSKSGWKIFLP